MKPNPQETADLIIFTEEILNGKHHFLQRWPPFFFLSTNSIFAIMFITVYIIGFSQHMQYMQYHLFGC